MTEIWLSVKGYEGLYEVSNIGNVRRVGGKLLSPKPGKLGYKIVSLSMNGYFKKHLVHRLVAEAFIPNPDNKTDVNHKDGNKTNNCVENLEWVSRSENILHAYTHGLSHPKCKPCRCVETGTVFPSTVVAEKWVGIKPGNCRIQSVCNHRKGAITCGGYHWEWV